MFTKEITYKDYNGVERKEKFLFNLTEAEIMEMEMGTTGGFVEMINKVVEAKDAPSIIKIFKDLILKSYGEKSPDGRSFLKEDPETGKPLYNNFKYTEAYSKLFMELSTDDIAAAEFVKGIIPADASAKIDAAGGIEKFKEQMNVAALPNA